MINIIKNLPKKLYSYSGLSVVVRLGRLVVVTILSVVVVAPLLVVIMGFSELVTGIITPVLLWTWPSCIDLVVLKGFGGALKAFWVVVLRPGLIVASWPMWDDCVVGLGELGRGVVVRLTLDVTDWTENTVWKYCYNVKIVFFIKLILIISVTLKQCQECEKINKLHFFINNFDFILFDCKLKIVLFYTENSAELLLVEKKM